MRDADAIVEVCAACGASNRIPFARVHARAKCGRCSHPVREPTAPIEVDGPRLASLLAQSRVPVVVDF